MKLRNWAVLLTCLVLIAADDKGSAPPITFDEELIADKYGYAFAVSAADLDGDGDLDLTSGDTVNDVLYWYANDGQGVFKRHIVQDKEPGWFERMDIGDINGDKRPDIAIVKNLHGHLVWFENSGHPATDEKWKRHVITTNLQRAYDVALVDLNGDGLLDAAATAWVGNHVAWFANPGPSGGDKEWKKEIVDPELLESRTIRVADFNGDGKRDLLSTGRVGNLTAWYEQAAAGQPWKKHVVDSQSPQPIHGQPADLDGDGDPDVLMALGMLAPVDQPDTNEIVWYENVGKPGTGETWKKHVIGKLQNAFEGVAADLDGDRDLDVVATAWGSPGNVMWYENTGNSVPGWKPHLLKLKWERANQPCVADLDGDQRPDIAATAERGSNELRWWRNRGPAK